MLVAADIRVFPLAAIKSVIGRAFAYRRIASKVGKTKMVGSVLSENEVRSLL